MRKNYDFSKARRGSVIAPPPGTTRISLRIDDDVLDWFRKRVHEAGGGDYQAVMNRALRATMERPAESVEETLRRVLGEVLAGSKARRKTSKGRAG